MQFFRKNKADKAWEQMEDLLSRDLPTKERERNPIPIWWMAAMLLPLCLGVGYYIGVKTATKAITHQQITKSVKKQLDLVNHSEIGRAHV